MLLVNRDELNRLFIKKERQVQKVIAELSYFTLRYSTKITKIISKIILHV